MDESEAWLLQAMSDREAAERFMVDAKAQFWCHAIAKWQQSVEKAVKSLVAALGEARILAIQIGYKHEVTTFISILVRLPRLAKYREIQSQLQRLLDAGTRNWIEDLEGLAPKRPAPGDPPGRNTEYPFRDEDMNWTYPAADGVFSETEIERFRKLAHRVVFRSDRIRSLIRRGRA